MKTDKIIEKKLTWHETNIVFKKWKQKNYKKGMETNEINKGKYSKTKKFKQNF
jgi:hypothetical protein